jgi:hypothetical protein
MEAVAFSPNRPLDPFWPRVALTAPRSEDWRWCALQLETLRSLDSPLIYYSD